MPGCTGVLVSSQTPGVEQSSGAQVDSRSNISSESWPAQTGTRHCCVSYMAFTLVPVGRWEGTNSKSTVASRHRALLDGNDSEWDLLSYPTSHII